MGAIGDQFPDITGSLWNRGSRPSPGQVTTWEIHDTTSSSQALSVNDFPDNEVNYRPFVTFEGNTLQIPWNVQLMSAITYLDRGVEVYFLLGGRKIRFRGQGWSQIFVYDTPLQNRKLGALVIKEGAGAGGSIYLQIRGNLSSKRDRVRS